MRTFGLTDADLYPLLTPASDAMLRRLREHPHAPKYNWQTGERLPAAMLNNVHTFAQQVQHTSLATQRREAAATRALWRDTFVEDCIRRVPFYRDRLRSGTAFNQHRLTTRDQIADAPWAFVPDDQPLDEIITYTTSGTTGTRLQYFATPETPARYLPLIERALKQVDVSLPRGSDRIALMHICAQRGTVILGAISSYLDGAGFLKINLDPADWNDAGDTDRFINDLSPHVLIGDPFALLQLADRPGVAITPAAIVSSAASLNVGQRQRLVERFRCPMIDLYSMNETGPLGYALDGEPRHIVFDSHNYIELLDADGEPASPGSMGQIVVTGGINPCLPLVRYATGDFARVDTISTGATTIHQLHARRPVTFIASDGRTFASVDASTALVQSPLGSLSLHQHANRDLTLTCAGDPTAIADALHQLRTLFGVDQHITVVQTDGTVLDGKRISYSSDWDGSAR